MILFFYVYSGSKATKKISRIKSSEKALYRKIDYFCIMRKQNTFSDQGLNNDKQMKKIILLTIITACLLTGCSNRPSTTDKLLDEIERAIEVNPDSASNMMQSISDPEKLDDKTFARWCMLSGKITDNAFTPLLPTYHLEKAYEWYSANGTPEDQVQMLIYLGRSNVIDGDYDKAMSIYTNALEIGEKHKLNNLMGYTYSYMGDLYEGKAMQSEALKKYEAAAEYFKKENNTVSYACALRDMGREYAMLDSLSHALEILFIADSIADISGNKEVKSTIFNSLGNIYSLQMHYDKAEEYFIKALNGREKMPNYMALIELYIETDSINKAKQLLQEIPKDSPDYEYSIKSLYYLINKSEGNHEEALANLEESTAIADSIMHSINQTKILDIEAKYNHLKIKQEVDRLKIKQLSYIIVIIISIIGLLVVTVGYLLYRKKTNERIQNQEAELNKLNIELLNISLELEKKKGLLKTLEEKDEEYAKMKEEIDKLSANYKNLQNKILFNSSSYKKLLHLASKNIPGNKSPLIHEDLWKLITNEVTNIYPEFYNYIYSLCQDLTEQDFQYSCLLLYGFDTNIEAKLLNIINGSARTKRLRFKQKLNIELPPSSTLQKYLTENMH